MTKNNSTKDYIQFKKSLLWPIVCGILAVALLIVIFTKNNNPNIQNNQMIQRNSYPTVNAVPVSLPTEKNYDHFIKKIILIKYLDHLKNELMAGTGCIVESGNKKFVLTSFDNSNQSEYIRNNLNLRNLGTTSTPVEIIGIAFPGTPSEKRFNLKASNIYYSFTYYLESFEDLSFLDSFLYTKIDTLSPKTPVLLLGFSANHLTSHQKIVGQSKIVGNEAEIFNGFNNINNTLFSNFTAIPTIPCQHKLMNSFIVLNNKNELLGISETSFSNLDPKRFYFIIDPLNTSERFISNRIPSKNNTNNIEIPNQIMLSNPAKPSQISLNSISIVKTDTINSPINKNYDHFIKKMIYIKYFDQHKNELMVGIGYIIESGGKQFVLTSFDTSFQSNNILSILSTQDKKQPTTSIEIVGVAYPGSTSEKKFPLKVSNIYYDRIFYLEPQENLSYLESFLYTDIKKLTPDNPVTILGFSANLFSSLQSIVGKPQVVGNEAKISEGFNNRNSLFINYTISLTIPCNNKLLPSFIVLNDNNEILGISDNGLSSPHARFMKTIIDPVNISREILFKNSIRNR